MPIRDQLDATQWSALQAQLSERAVVGTLCPGTYPKYARLRLGFAELVSRHTLPGDNTSGYIVMAGCQLRCPFCIYYDVARLGAGQVISADQLADTLCDVKDSGASSCIFVTATHQAHLVLQAIRIATNQGFDLPIGWETSGYESVDMINLLSEFVDFFLFGLKTTDDGVGELLGVADYATVAKNAVLRAFELKGPLALDEEDRPVRGVSLRLLPIPDYMDDFRDLAAWVLQELGPDIPVQVLDEFSPAIEDVPALQRLLTPEEKAEALAAVSGLSVHG